MKSLDYQFHATEFVLTTDTKEIKNHQDARQDGTKHSPGTQGHYNGL